MKQIEISDHQFEICTNLLDSHEGQPTVVGYSRTACAVQETGLSYSLEMQCNTIMETVRRKFGDDFRIIWISETGPGNGLTTHLPGLKLVAKLVEIGIAQHVAVCDHSRICRNPLACFEFINLLSEHGASLITPASEEVFSTRAFEIPDCQLVHLIFGMCLGDKRPSKTDDTQSEEHGDAHDA